MQEYQAVTLRLVEAGRDIEALRGMERIAKIEADSMDVPVALERIAVACTKG